jgi:hypothetical protein
MTLMLIAIVLNYGVYCGEVPENIRTKVAAVMQNLTPDQRWALEHGRVGGYEQIGSPSRVTVRISSMPSRMEPETPDQSRSRRRARLRSRVFQGVTG